jgi:AcrR family transcriptional regulator
MAVALRLFSEHDIDATSTRDILTEAGVNAGAIHYHFRSKRNLVIELMNTSFELVGDLETASFDRVEQEQDPSPESVVEAFIAPMATLAADERGRQTVRFLLSTWRHPEFAELHREREQEMMRRRLRAVARIAPSASPAEHAVWSVVLAGVAIRFIANREGDSVVAAVLPGSEADVPAAVTRMLTNSLGGAITPPRRATVATS